MGWRALPAGVAPHSAGGKGPGGEGTAAMAVGAARPECLGRLFHKGSRAEPSAPGLPSRAPASEPASSQECPGYSGPRRPASPGAPSLDSRGRAAPPKLARLNQVPRKRPTAARALLSSRQGRRGAGLGAGPGALAGEPLLLEPDGPGLARKAARRAGCGRAGLVRGSLRPSPRLARQRGARVPSTESRRTEAGRRCPRAVRGRGRHGSRGAGRGPAAPDAPRPPRPPPRTRG